jgi:hypothetical protein
MIAKRANPYRPWLRNVYVRRLFVVTIVPIILIFVAIPIIAFEAVARELPRIFKVNLNAIKDGNSYGRF